MLEGSLLAGYRSRWGGGGDWGEGPHVTCQFRKFSCAMSFVNVAMSSRNLPRDITFHVLVVFSPENYC